MRQEKKRQGKALAVLLVLLGGASYGILSPLVKMAYQAGYSAGDVTSSQFTAAALILWLAAAGHIQQLRRLRARDWGILLLIGLLSAGTTLSYYFSLTGLPASLAIVLLFQFTWITLLLEILFTRRMPPFYHWVALLFILLGTVFAVNLWHADWQQVSRQGIMLALLAAFAYALFLHVNSYIPSQTPAILNSAIMVSAAALAVYLFFPPVFLGNGEIQRGLWVWALLIGSFGQVFPPILFTLGIPRIGGALAAILGAIELPVGVVAAFILLREPVVLVQWLGILLILGGMALTRWQGKKRVSTG